MKGKNKLAEIEAELKALLEREESRKQDYEARLTDYEVKLLEKELENEAKALKGEYPDFDENKELENEVFVKLLLAGLDMKTAYEAVHLADIKARDEAEKAAKAKNAVRRPVENGSLGSESALFKSGVHSLTGKDRAELARRALRGEIIRF